MFNKKTLLFFFVFLNFFTFGQNIAIGQWREHLPYNSCISVTEGRNKIYCASRNAIFSYNVLDNSFERISKVNGLSEVGINTISFYKEYDILLIAYSNANIDLIENNHIINISDIKRKQISGKKYINKIRFHNQFAYLACSFGIIVLDLTKKEIKDTYYIGPNGTSIEVFDIAFDDSNIFGATEKGIYKASLNSPNLLNYESWVRMNNITQPAGKYTQMVYFGNKLYVNRSTTAADSMFVYDGVNWKIFEAGNGNKRFSIQNHFNKMVVCSLWNLDVFDESGAKIQHAGIYVPNDATCDAYGSVWIADQSDGLIKFSSYSMENIIPNSPRSSNVNAMDVQGSKLWVAPGGKDDTWTRLYNNDGVYSFIDEKWNALGYGKSPAIDSVRDFISVAVDPTNPDKAYLGTWGNGLFEITGQEVTAVYNPQNSTISNIEGFANMYWVGVGGIAFDKSHNMWVTSARTSNVLSVKKADATWKNFRFNLTGEKVVANIVIDDHDQKWMIMPRENSIIVFNDNGTIDNTADDKYKVLTPGSGYGNLRGNVIFSIAKDRDGEIWVGCDQGVEVFYTPENILNGGDIDAQQILLTQDGNAQYLLETEVVTAIAVDGANRKWLGTQNGGVFLMSPDGTTEVLHFTEENSPLLSNSITSIAIDQITGEVFFGTIKGIISYKGTATEGGEKFQDGVYAYPNPVNENYNGLIGIKGLVENADVKITDIAGNVVYKTIANGGQAVWDGKTITGNRATTGVYLVLCSSANGTEKLVTKILFVN